MRVLAKLRKHNKKDIYSTSRVMYWFEAAFEYFINLLASGAFLAKLTSEIGITDSMTAILTAITSLAGASQMVSIYLSHKAPVKRFVLPLMLISQIMFSTLYLIPFLPMGSVGMAAVFFAVILISKFVLTICSPLKSAWFMNLVQIKDRGSYTAILQIVSLVLGSAVSFAAGVLIDNFEAVGDVKGAFLTLSVLILVFALGNCLTLVFSREKPLEKKQSETVFSSVKTLFKNKNYKHLLVILILEAVANNVIVPFLGTYQVNELGFKMTFISVMGIALSAVQVLSVAFFGRLSKNFEHKTLLQVGFPIIVISYFINIFTAPSNGIYMFIIYSVILRIGSAALGVSKVNLMLEMIPRENHVAAISISTMITGILSFIATLAVSPFTDFVQNNNNTVFGKTIYAQQLLSALAFVIYIVATVYYNAVLVPRLNNKENRVYD